MVGRHRADHERFLNMHHMSVVPPNDHSKPISALSVISSFQKKERTKVLDCVDGTYEEKKRGRSLPP